MVKFPDEQAGMVEGRRIQEDRKVDRIFALVSLILLLE
jgi:hypothetical protein